MSTTPTAALVVVAEGSGTRAGTRTNNVYLPLAGRPVVSWALEYCQVPGVGPVGLVIREQDRARAEAVVRESGGPVELVVGGATRHESEFLGLTHVASAIRSGQVDMVLIHDAARPLVDTSLVRELLEAARRLGATVPGVGLTDVWEDSPDRRHRPAPGGNGMVAMQAPQALRAALLLNTYEQAEKDGFVGTDAAACIERYADLSVHCLPGYPHNRKLTYPEDLLIAEQLLSRGTAAPAQRACNPQTSPGQSPTRTLPG